MFLGRRRALRRAAYGLSGCAAIGVIALLIVQLFAGPAGTAPSAGSLSIGGPDPAVEEEQDVDVGVQAELPAAIAAERDDQAGAGRRHADRNRIGDGAVPHGSQPIERRARPGSTRRLDEGAALRGRFQMALPGGRERSGKLCDRA